MAEDLVTFLRARIDEAEDAADGIHAYYCANTVDDTLCNCGVPARTLAEVAVRRAIFKLHREGTDSARGELIGDGVCRECDLRFPCGTLRLLAAPYADHPNFRPEWGTER